MTAFKVTRRDVMMGMAAATALPKVGWAQGTRKRGGTP